jgi:hypothetical protein
MGLLAIRKFPILMPGRAKKRVVVIVATTAVLVLVAAVLVPRLLDLNRYRGRIVAELEELLGGEVTLGEISWGVSNGLWVKLHDITIQNATAVPLDLVLPETYVRVAIRPLFSKHVEVAKLQLNQASATIRLSPPGDKSGDDSTTPDSLSQGVQSPVPIKAEQVVLKDGRVTVIDSLSSTVESVVHQLVDVNISLKHFVPGDDIEFQIDFRDSTAAGLGSLELEGVFSGLSERLTVEHPHLRASARLIEFPVDAIEPYVTGGIPVQQLGGSVSLNVTYEGNLGRQSTVEGLIDLSDIAYTNHHAWGNSLPGRDSKIDLRGRLEGDDLHIDKFNLAMKGISVSTDGTILGLSKQPTINNGALTARIELKEVISLMPWRLLRRDEKELRDVLSDGGSIEINRCTVPEITFSKIANDPAALFNGLDASIHIDSVSMRPSVNFPKLEGISAYVELKNGSLDARDAIGRYRAFHLPSLDLRFERLTDKPRITIAAAGPLKIPEIADADTKKLLADYGLHSISGNARLDMNIVFDAGKLNRWETETYLTLDGINAESYPEKFAIDNLRGRISLEHGESTTIVADSVSGLADGNPFVLAGRMVRGGPDVLLIDAQVRTKGFDLKHFSAFFPELEPLLIGGIVDVDFDIHYPRARPSDTKLNGTVTTRGLTLLLSERNIDIRDIDADIVLDGRSVTVDTLSLKIADQPLELSGRFEDPHKLNGSLRVYSPDFDLDRILANYGKGEGDKTQPRKPDSLDVRKAGMVELPSLLREAVFTLSIDVEKGRFRDTAFRDLTFLAEYDRGTVKSHRFDVSIADGTFGTTGSADLKDLEQVSFVIQPELRGFQLKSLERLAIVDSVPIHGPLDFSGTVSGQTGSTRGFLASLDGRVRVESGPGLIVSSSRAGRNVFDLLTAIKLSGLLSGDVKDEVSKEGIPFESIHIGAVFQSGKIVVDTLRMVTTAMTVDGYGTIDLIRNSGDIEADIVIFETASDILGMVPIVGKAAAKFVSLHATLEGPLDQPEITVSPLGGLTKGIKDALKEAGKTIKGVFE